MTLADYFLYTIWFLFPAFFFGVALWGKLERFSGNKNREDPGDYIRNGSILLACAFIALIIDRHALEPMILNTIGDILPLGFFRVMLFPVILLIAATLIGPSRDIRIEKAPDLNTLKGRKRK